MHKELITFLQSLSRMTPTERYEHIKILTDKEIDFLSEVCKNFLKKKIKTGICVINRLKPVRKELIALSNKKITRKNKKIILKTLKGGFVLNSLLPYAISTLMSI